MTSRRRLGAWVLKRAAMLWRRVSSTRCDTGARLVDSATDVGSGLVLEATTTAKRTETSGASTEEVFLFASKVDACACSSAYCDRMLSNWHKVDFWGMKLEKYVENVAADPKEYRWTFELKSLYFAYFGLQLKGFIDEVRSRVMKKWEQSPATEWEATVDEVIKMWLSDD